MVWSWYPSLPCRPCPRRDSQLLQKIQHRPWCTFESSPACCNSLLTRWNSPKPLPVPLCTPPEDPALAPPRKFGAEEESGLCRAPVCPGMCTMEGPRSLPSPARSRLGSSGCFSLPLLLPAGGEGSSAPGLRGSAFVGSDFCLRALRCEEGHVFAWCLRALFV